MSKSTRRYLVVAGLVLAVTLPGAVLWLIGGHTVIGLVCLAGSGLAAAQLGQAAAEAVDD
ncbi:MAG: hypothetical protein V4515_00040 [Chloroflexota bacterium]